MGAQCFEFSRMRAQFLLCLQICEVLLDLEFSKVGNLFWLTRYITDETPTHGRISLVNLVTYMPIE